MKAVQAHTVIALRKNGCTHPLIETLFQAPLCQKLSHFEEVTLLSLAQANDIEITHYEETLVDIANGKGAVIRTELKGW